MTLTLVSSGDDRARAIRDHLLPLVRRDGSQEVQRDAVRLISLRIGPWSIVHWTPFNELASGEASSPGYRHALERQQAAPSLPYGMEVSRDGTKLLGILWADDGSWDIVSFQRGPWEKDALSL
ncbi:hypothetical protein E2C06_11510 [Dankookia rubra]|uniref:Uncharacterized protein n=1 Tax=Dankookia rubra TaxID=1442381 RepID=A0A4R5QGS2_9PROT|nr:hypothetical protein [Dankookia rubra]TDH62490.1 hypothetical protein E2C06_11510 [Dankookia rubra]